MSFGVDLNNVPELGSYGLVAGEYTVILTKVRPFFWDVIDTKAGLYDYQEGMSGVDQKDVQHELVFQVIDGEYKGKEFNQLLSLFSDNDIRAKISKSTLKSLAVALNVSLEQGSFSDLKDKPFKVTIEYTKSKKDPSKSFLNVKNICGMNAVAQNPTQSQNTVSEDTKKVINTDKPGWSFGK